MSDSILIKNGIIITLGDEPKVLYDNSVLIENGLIKKIAPSEEFKREQRKEIDAGGKVVLPGFINAHMHFYSTLVRGLGKAKPAKDFLEVLENLWWKLDKVLTPETLYYSALIMLINGIKRGTTTFLDHHASPKSVTGSLRKISKAVEETGLRACLCYELSDRDGEKISEEGIKENYEFIKYTQENNSELLRALFGLHASFTLSDRTLERASETGSGLKTGFHIHVAEAELDEVYSEKNFGMRVVNRLHKFGILGEKTIAAHCVHIDENEMEILKDTGTMVVHNPQSNLNNAVGIADVVKMANKGILVGLGTDAMTVNMIEELRVALWAQHLKQKNPTAGFNETASTLFYSNAKIAGRYWSSSLGKIEEGAAADVILIDYEPPTPLDESNFLGHLIFGISQSDTDTTIVNGRVLMENRILKIDIDESEIAARARELTNKLWNRF